MFAQSDPPDLSPPRAITFAPNVDAETYGAPPPLIDPPSSTLFPSSPSSPDASPRRASHARKKPDDWIPRPPNAFILFRSEMVEQFIKSQHVPGDVEANHGNLSKIIGLCWRNLPFPERSVWEHKARLAQAAHKAQYPHYRFRPHAKGATNSSGGGGGGKEGKDGVKGGARPKRRVKEPPAPPDARRVAHIAGLLVDGVKGAKLARAVKALDEERKEVVEMRFDEPVTAAMFGGEVGEKKSAKTRKTQVKHLDLDLAMPDSDADPIMFDPHALPDVQEQLAWAPSPTAAWSPADDTGTWSPADDTGGRGWSPVEDTSGRGWSPTDDTGTWSTTEETVPWTGWSQDSFSAPQTWSNDAYAFPPALSPSESSPADTPQRSPALAPAAAYAYPPPGHDVFAQCQQLEFDGRELVYDVPTMGIEYMHAPMPAVQCFEF